MKNNFTKITGDSSECGQLDEDEGWGESCLDFLREERNEGGIAS